jgi:hypothetical protein
MAWNSIMYHNLIKLISSILLGPRSAVPLPLYILSLAQWHATPLSSLCVQSQATGGGDSLAFIRASPVARRKRTLSYHLRPP